MRLNSPLSKQIHKQSARPHTKKRKTKYFTVNTSLNESNYSI